MPTNKPLQPILVRAEEKEKKYDWLRATEFYNEALADALKLKDIQRAGEIQERIGFCFHRFAMQAKTQKEFRGGIQQAIAAYEKARQFYESLSKSKRSARELRCDAAIKYLSYWLTPNPNEKKKLLDGCLESEGKALSGFLETGDMLEYARTYNGLSLVFFLRIFLEEDRQALRSILKKGLEWGKKALAKTAKHDDVIGWTHFTMATCLSDSGFYLISESEKIDKYRLRAVEHLNKALTLSENTGDALLSGLLHLWLGINMGEEEAARHHQSALEYGKLTSDNFLIANGLDYLAYDTYWKARARAIENPETRRELAEKAIEFYEKANHHYSIMSFMSPRGGLLGPPSGQAEHFYQLALWEPNLGKRREFLEKSKKLGIDALKSAEESGMPLVIAQVLHVLSKTLQAEAGMEHNPLEKRDHLEEALKHRKRTIEIQERLSPFFYWNRGVMLNYLAGITAELAVIEPDPKDRIDLLKEAVLSSEECVRLCSKVMPDFERKGETMLFAALRDYQDTFATLLTRLYKLTNKTDYLRKAIEALLEAIKSAGKLDMVSLTAELHWKIAKAKDTLGEHLASAKNYRHASESYIEAAEKVPQLNSFYRDHALYMQAWNEIEKAKYSHAQERCEQAKKHYEKAASLHNSTKRWKYLSSNYSAWAHLEKAEDLSRREKAREAAELFRKASKLFRDARITLQTSKERIQDEYEEDLAKRLIKASGIREKYCIGRIALEEAKILGGQDDNSASSRKYGLAAKIFQQVLETIERESRFTNATKAKDRQELMPIIYLSRAWEKMKKAEAEASPELYLEASRLFNEAKEYGTNERAKLLALGHSRFCRALEAGARFEDSRDPKFYSDATQHLESAANYYFKAGFKTASEYAVATQRLLDAYVYMGNAQKEVDPGKKTKFYMVAEKVLQTSIGSFLKARQPGKSKQVQRLLEKVREEKKLAVSLSEILNAPSATSSTASFVTPTPSEETAVGVEKFEQANLQANLIVPTKEVPIGEGLNLKMQITNVGKQAVLLDKIEGITPSGFEVVTKPNRYFLEDMNLNMNGRRLDPLSTEEFNLVLKPFEKGTFEINPRMVYVDETGSQMVSALEPVTVKVSKIVLPDRITTGHEGLDDLLFGGIPQNYAVILTSPSCDERDSLIRSFLESGAKKGQTTFHITTRAIGLEDLTKEYPSNFYVFICNPKANEITKSLPNVYKLKGIENLTEISIALTMALRKLNAAVKAPRRCCIQIVSDILLQHQALQTRRWLNGLLPELRSKGFTVLAVMDPGMHSQQDVRAVLDLFDGEINIYEKEKVGFIRIKRMTEQEYSERESRLSK